MKILIVDDSSTAVALLQVFLVGRDAEIRVASDGAEALRLARQMVPDVVVTDLVMPGMDGSQLCAALRSDPLLSQVPVVVLSTRSDPESRRRCQLAGARAYLTKPASPAELRRAVESVRARATEEIGPAV